MKSLKEVKHLGRIFTEELVQNQIGMLWFPVSATDFIVSRTVPARISYVNDMTLLWYTGRNQITPLIAYHGSVSRERLLHTRGWRDTKQHKRVSSLSSYTHARSQSQALQLYDWEDTYVPEDTVSRKTAERIVKELLPFDVNVYHQKLEIDVFGKANVSRRGGIFSPPYQVDIFLQSRTPIRLNVVLHECAHLMDFHLYKSHSHSPSFAAIYAHYLKDYGLMKNPKKSMQNNGLSVVEEILW